MSDVMTEIKSPLSETIQYDQGKERLMQMNQKTDMLLETEKRMKRTMGRNMAVTNTAILISDLAMLFLSSALYQNGTVDFGGVLLQNAGTALRAWTSHCRFSL